MLQLAEDVFAVRRDPDQLDVNEAVIEKLQHIHPSTLSEHIDGDGPVVWILLIPTTLETMNKFLSHDYTERELFEKTNPGEKYEAIYLCSALVLPEFRSKGLAKKLSIEAINAIREKHRIKSLFVWPFSEEGNKLAEKIAMTRGLALMKRKK